MRTIEEVKKHLREVVYNDAEDRMYILGFLKGKGFFNPCIDEDLEFAEYEECNYADFLAWWDKANEEEDGKEAVDNEADKIISEIEESLKKRGFACITVNAEPSDEVCKTALDFCKEQKMMALEELEKSEKELDEKIKGLTNERAKSFAERLLAFSKEIKEEYKKTFNE